MVVDAVEAVRACALALVVAKAWPTAVASEALVEDLAEEVDEPITSLAKLDVLIDTGDVEDAKAVFAGDTVAVAAAADLVTLAPNNSCTGAQSADPSSVGVGGRALDTTANPPVLLGQLGAVFVGV